MKHTLWIKIAAVLQLLSAAFHSISFVVPMQGTTDAENQVIEMMKNVPVDNMMGGHTSFLQLFTTLSAGFALLFVFGGLLNFYLVKKADTALLKGVTSLQVLVFGIMFAVCADLSFLFPIICSGLVFLALIIARLTFPKNPISA